MQRPPSAHPGNLAKLPPLLGNTFASLLSTPAMVEVDGEDLPSSKEKSGC